jgi:hypothetical protein
MSDLWIYRRRPSSLTRYRHGGAAAFDPAVRSPLVSAAVVNASPALDDGKILQFPAPAAPTGPTRPKRADKPRRGRAKPTPPKKRDS